MSDVFHLAREELVKPRMLCDVCCDPVPLLARPSSEKGRLHSAMVARHRLMAPSEKCHACKPDLLFRAPGAFEKAEVISAARPGNSRRQGEVERSCHFPSRGRGSPR